MRRPTYFAAQVRKEELEASRKKVKEASKMEG